MMIFKKTAVYRYSRTIFVVTALFYATRGQHNRKERPATLQNYPVYG